jgi:hypothetical protein
LFSVAFGPARLHFALDSMRTRLLCVGILLGLLACVCFADSWMRPTRRTYLSETKDYRFTVQPPDLSSQEAFLALDNEDYLTVNVLEKRNTSRQIHCEGLLERRNKKGHYELIWRRPLLNRVAPATVLISEVALPGIAGAVQVVTFDDWHHVGTSSNTVVVYSLVGSVICRYALADLIPTSDIQQLDASVSSVSWRHKSVVDADGRLVLTIPKTKPVFIDLQTGKASR